MGEDEIKFPICTIREDLQKSGLEIPVRYSGIWSYIHGDKEYSYRWINDDVFQIFIDGIWYDAHSIDFDFLS